MKKNTVIILVILFHLIVAYILLSGHQLGGSIVLLAGYFYAFFAKQIDRIIKKIIKVANDSSND